MRKSLNLRLKYAERLEEGRLDSMVMQKIAKKVKSRKGQGSVEYIMLIAVIVAVVFAFRGVITTKIKDVTTSLFDTVGKGITDAANY